MCEGCLDSSLFKKRVLASLAQQRLSEVGQLFVCYVFDLDLSVKYLKVTISYTQKSVKFRSGFIFYKNVN